MDVNKKARGMQKTLAFCKQNRNNAFTYFAKDTGTDEKHDLVKPTDQKALVLDQKIPRKATVTHKLDKNTQQPPATISDVTHTHTHNKCALTNQFSSSIQTQPD